MEALLEGAVLGQYAEDDEAKLSGDGADSDPVVLAPLPEALVVGGKLRVVEGGDASRGVERPPQVGRAALGHVHLGAFEAAGLRDGGVDPGVGDELLGILEAVDVADFAQDDGAKDGADARNCGDETVRPLHVGGDFPVETVDLVLDEADLLEDLAELEGKRVGGDRDPERMTGGVLDLERLVLAKAPPAGLLQKVRKLSGIDLAQFFRRRPVQKDFSGSHAERVRKELFIFREDLVQKRDRLALEVRAQVDLVGTKAAQLAQGQGLLAAGRRLLVLAQAQDPGDDHGIDGVGLGLPDGHVPVGVGHDRVDDLDAKALPDQERVDHQPVVAGGLHADDGAGGRSASLFQMAEKLLGASRGVRDFQGRTGRFAGVAENGRFVDVLCDVDANVKHAAPSLSEKALQKEVIHMALREHNLVRHTGPITPSSSFVSCPQR